MGILGATTAGANKCANQMTDGPRRVSGIRAKSDRETHLRGITLCNIGYTITGAAIAAGVKVRVIEMAIASRDLVARRVDNKPVVLCADIRAWLEVMPNWLD